MFMRRYRGWGGQGGCLGVGGGRGGCTLQAGDETVVEGVQLQLAGAHGLGESLLAACCTGQAHVAPHLCQPLLKALLHLIHTCVGCLKVLLQLWSQSVALDGPDPSGVPLGPTISVMITTGSDNTMVVLMQYFTD